MKKTLVSPISTPPAIDYKPPETFTKTDISKAAQLLLQIPESGNLAGVEMGIHSDGRAFLSQTGVAQMCGVQQSVISAFTKEVHQQKPNGRAATLRRMLSEIGWSGASLYEAIKHDGKELYAYEDKVCIAFVKY